MLQRSCTEGLPPRCTNLAISCSSIWLQSWYFKSFCASWNRIFRRVAMQRWSLLTQNFPASTAQLVMDRRGDIIIQSVNAALRPPSICLSSDNIPIHTPDEEFIIHTEARLNLELTMLLWDAHQNETPTVSARHQSGSSKCLKRCQSHSKDLMKSDAYEQAGTVLQPFPDSADFSQEFDRYNSIHLVVYVRHKRGDGRSSNKSTWECQPALECLVRSGFLTSSITFPFYGITMNASQLGHMWTERHSYFCLARHIGTLQFRSVNSWRCSVIRLKFGKKSRLPFREID